MLRFLKNFDRDIRPALLDEHPEMSPADVEVFKRKWICKPVVLYVIWPRCPVMLTIVIVRSCALSDYL